MTAPITLSAEGYTDLAIILRDAFLQASEGKGAERHANSKPFHEQPMQTISDLFDSDKGMAFQIVKKLREGLDMPEYERLERELLGVIVYTAGAILWHKRRHVAKNAALVDAVELPYMSDPANWLPGDMVMAVNSSSNQFTEGMFYELRDHVDSVQDSVRVAKDDTGHPNGWGVYNFVWHSRPTK